MKNIFIAFFLVVLSFSAFPKFEVTKVGIRGGLGTDIGGGVAYGVGVNYLVDLNGNNIEAGILYFGGSFEESSDENGHTYDETTDISVFGLMANYLFNYNPSSQGTFFIAGVGIASISAEWTEESETDTSLGTALSTGGSQQYFEGSGAGSVLNLGVGWTLGTNMDIRAEVPVIVTFTEVGEAASVIPTIIATLGYRF